MPLRIFLRRLLLIGSFACAVVAQTPSTDGSYNSASSLTLPAGTLIRLHNFTDLASNLARAGDSISFEVLEPVESGGLVIIPKHAIASGKIVKSEHSHWGGRSGNLAINIEEVQTITGAPVKVRPHIEPKKKVKISAGEVAGGLLLLPFFLAAAPSALIAPGQEKWIPPGSDFSVETIDPLPLDIPSITKWQRNDPLAAAYAEVVLYRTNVSHSDRKMWEVNCSGDNVTTLVEGRFVRFFLPAGNYWLKTEGRTIAIERKEVPKSQAMHLLPNTQYVFEFSTWNGSVFAKGPHGYLQGFGADAGDTLFWQHHEDSVNDFKRTDTLDDPKPLACDWKKGVPFTTQRRNGFAVVDGSPIELRLMQDWSSATAKLGDKVQFVLVNDFDVRGVSILKAGDEIDAYVTVPSIVNPKYFKDRFDLVIPHITLPDGQQMSVRTTEARQRRYTRNEGAPIVSGTGFTLGSPYVIEKKGPAVQLARGTVVTIYVEDNYLLNPAKLIQNAALEAHTAR
jgi:hypothetical protein